MPRSRSAFTLLEMLIVLSLMAIFISAIMPSPDSTAADRLQAAARAIASDVDYCRSLAVSNDSQYEIKFDLANNRYVIRHSGSNASLDALKSRVMRDRDDDRRRTVRLDELPRMGAAASIVSVQSVGSERTEVDAVEFGSMGQTTRAEETVIWLACGEGSNRRYVAVSINPVTGLATRQATSNVAPPAATELAGGEADADAHVVEPDAP